MTPPKPKLLRIHATITHQCLQCSALAHATLEHFDLCWTTWEYFEAAASARNDRGSVHQSMRQTPAISLGHPLASLIMCILFSVSVAIITIQILGCLLDPPTLERLSFLMNLLNLFSNRCHHLTFDSRLLVTNACRLSDQFTSTASVMMNIDQLIPMKTLWTDQFTSSKYHSV